jgi:hypothetical protein
MFSNSFKTFNPAEKDGLQVFQCQALPYDYDCGDNLFNCLKQPVIHFVLQHLIEPKVARTQPWPIKWVEKAFPLLIRGFIGDLLIIIAGRIVILDMKLALPMFKVNSHLFTNKNR